MKTKVLLDIDGVLAKFYAGFAGHLNKTLNTGLDLSTEPGEYSMHKWGHSLPDEQVNAEVPKWIISGGYKDMPIYPGAKEFVYQLMDKYNVFVVTARVGDFRIDFSEEMIDIIKSDSIKWFQKHGIPSDKLVFEHQKIKFCKDNDINILIEDKLSTVVDGAARGIQSILINRGWNQEGEAWYGEHLSRNHPNIHVAEDYNQLLDIVKNVS